MVQNKLSDGIKILILGGTNLIGPWLIQKLCQLGHSVTIFNRGETRAHLPSEVKRIYGDRRRLKEYQKELLYVSPDIVIDMIAMTESDAEQLVDIFQGNLKKLVVMSSGDVYLAHQILCEAFSESYESLPINENAKLREASYPYRKYAKNNEDLFYTYDKCKVEAVINSSSIDTTVLRLPFVYGPGDTRRVLPYLKNMNDHVPEILLDTQKAKWRSTRGYVEDIAKAILLAALDKRKGKFTYNVGEIRALSEKEWIQKIAEIVGWEGAIVEKEKQALPENLQESFNWNQSLVFDTSKIREDLAYKEGFSGKQALTKTIEWALTNIQD